MSIGNAFVSFSSCWIGLWGLASVSLWNWFSLDLVFNIRDLFCQRAQAERWLQKVPWGLLEGIALASSSCFLCDPAVFDISSIDACGFMILRSTGVWSALLLVLFCSRHTLSTDVLSLTALLRQSVVASWLCLMQQLSCSHWCHFYL